MSIPFFYIQYSFDQRKDIELDKDASHHIVQVLRMKEGEQLNLTDGKGNVLTTKILEAHKKHCLVQVIDSRFTVQDSRRITIGISLIKNSSRFEWFLEKATELGIHEIIPLICERTEKEKFRRDRLEGVMTSAMLQSQQSWLPELHDPVRYNEIVKSSHQQQKFIAHCIEQEKRNLSDVINENLSSQIILIGPEGDFTRQEVELALQHHFIAVALGETRLRAETAGIVAAALLKSC